jgi:hypothetical protein
LNVKSLVPPPTTREPFLASRLRFIPTAAGSYVLTTFAGAILYIGLTDNLRRRVKEHLDSKDKTRLTDNGRAIFFYWRENSTTARIERTWLNMYSLVHGRLPVLNRADSPISA